MLLIKTLSSGNSSYPMITTKKATAQRAGVEGLSAPLLANGQRLKCLVNHGGSLLSLQFI